MNIKQVDGTALMRRAILKWDPSAVLEAVDRLNLQPSGRVDVVILAPLRNLHRSRSVANFASGAPTPAVRFVGELLSNDALERVVEILGDAAGEPTFEQLSEAVDQLRNEDVDPATISLMLAVAAASHVPAEPHCRQLLSERDELALPELAASPPSSLLKTKEVDPQVREQRRRRREEQRVARQRTTSRTSTRPTKTKPPATPPAPVTPVVVGGEGANVAPVVNERRRVVLTPLESEEFDVDHPLAGVVVELEIPYDSPGDDEPGYSSKHRPAVVVAGSPTAVLVRAVFSRPATDRVLLVGWNRIGLDHVSYVGAPRIRAELTPGLRRFARLTDEEWNALF